jgi:uncharacterized RDD family membrane protein YckC
MENTLSNSEYDMPGASIIDDDDFIPIHPDWRKKYYKKAFGKRVIAYILDIFTTSILAYIPILIFIPNPENGETYDLWVYIFQYSLYFVIYAIMESSKWKGTFGKRIMQIEVSDDYGNAISFWRSIARNFLKLITSYSYIFIIPFIIQIFTYRKSGKLFHDYFSKTIIGERMNNSAINIEELSVDDINKEVSKGTKIVVFQYCFSIIIMSFKRESNSYFIKAGESTLKYSIGFTLITLIFGWWGIPWGPIYSVKALYSNITGGKDITQNVLLSMNSISQVNQPITSV